jgi:hypothetical protein
MRAPSPSIRSGHKKRRRRPYSATVHYDQEGNGPTSAAARHKCRAGQLFQLCTGTAQFIRQEGKMPCIGSWTYPFARMRHATARITLRGTSLSCTAAHSMLSDATSRSHLFPSSSSARAGTRSFYAILSREWQGISANRDCPAVIGQRASDLPLLPISKS